MSDIVVTNRCILQVLNDFLYMVVDPNYRPTYHGIRTLRLKAEGSLVHRGRTIARIYQHTPPTILVRRATRGLARTLWEYSGRAPGWIHQALPVQKVTPLGAHDHLLNLDVLRRDVQTCAHRAVHARRDVALRLREYDRAVGAYQRYQACFHVTGESPLAADDQERLIRRRVTLTLLASDEDA